MPPKKSLEDFTRAIGYVDDEKCADPSLTKRELRQLSEEFREEIEVGEYPIINLGEEEIPVIPYRWFLDSVEPGEAPCFTEKEYWNYLVAAIDSPDDVFRIMDTRNVFLEWREVRGNMVYDAEKTLAGGGGDCDNMAWVSKRLLDELGCKKGCDFKARVIGMGSHASCIYFNEQGQMCSIDQLYHRKNISDIYEGSDYYARGEDVLEIMTLKNGITLEVEIDPNTLQRNYNYLAVTIDGMLSVENITQHNPSELLPSDWSQYKLALFEYKNARLYYELGTLKQVTEEGIVTQYNEQSQIIQKKYLNGVVEFFDPISGRVRERNEANGEVYFFDEEGRVTQKNYTNGMIERFSPEGELSYRAYPEPNLIGEEFYYENGSTLRQRNYRSHELYEMEYFDEEGHRIQAVDKNGNLILFDKSTGRMTQKSYVEGNIEVEFFYENGESVKQRNFRNGEVRNEIYYLNGNIQQRYFREGGEYAICEYDEQGNMILAQKPDGSVVDFRPRN